jgi:ABC-type dipeptide/oligopeptide/nickel transport system ATPase subunit
MESAIKEIKQRLDSKMADYRSACSIVKSERRSLISSEIELDCAEEAQIILQHVAQSVQQEAHQKIAAVVTRCFETIFDDPYQFEIIFERKRGRTEARLVFIRDGVEMDPLRSSGGGVVDLASFALRLACLVLTRPPVRRLLVLDEPFKHLSAEYRPRVRDLLLALSNELEVQFVIITHDEIFKIGKVIEIG